MAKTNPLCGDFGGRLRDGRRCQRRAAWGRRDAKDGPCKDHGEDVDARVQSLKKAYLAELLKGTVSMRIAAQAADCDQATIWRWRQADPTFDAAVHDAQKGADHVRGQIVEDSLFSRLTKGTASAVEMIFYLINRVPHRWKHVQRVEHTGAEGKPIAHRLDLNKLSDAEIQRVKAAIIKARVPG